MVEGAALSTTVLQFPSYSVLKITDRYFEPQGIVNVSYLYNKFLTGTYPVYVFFFPKWRAAP